RTASKILTWLFLSTKGKIKHWNLFRLDELPSALRDARKRLSCCFGKDTGVLVLQTDIRQMFTNLKHSHVKRAIEWIIEKNVKMCARKTRRKPFINISSFRGNDGKYEIYWSTVKGSCGWKSIDILSLLNLVSIDLDNSFQYVGGKIY